MTKKRTKSLIIGLALMGLSQPLFAQDDILKDFAEERNSTKYCLYPSTLRMINLENNANYNELASSFEKFLIYQLDSITSTENSYKSVLTEYEENGFEEYISVYGDGTSVLVLGKEQRTNEMVGFFAQKDQIFMFHLLGNIAFQKIPTLINTFAENDLLNIFDLKIDQWD